MSKHSAESTITDVDPFEDFDSRKKRATINDVARLANVSKKTVSRVINQIPVRDEIRDSIISIIRRVNFRPSPQARGLALRSAQLVGLIYDNPNAQYVLDMQAGVLDTLCGTGLELIVRPCDRNEPDFLNDIKDFVTKQKLSRVILLPPIADHQELIKLLSTLNVRIAAVTAIDKKGLSNFIEVHQIVSNERSGSRMAADYLLNLGHRTIGFISGPEGFPSTYERRLGFTEGLAKHGLHLDREFEVEGNYTFESGYHAAKLLFSMPKRPTGIFASNDEMAIGVYHAAFDLGLRVPEDVNVIGFDDSQFASRIYPALTTVGLPAQEMGRQAAAAIIQKGALQRTRLTFEAALVVRESTCARA